MYLQLLSIFFHYTDSIFVVLVILFSISSAYLIYKNGQFRLKEPDLVDLEIRMKFAQGKDFDNLLLEYIKILNSIK